MSTRLILRLNLEPVCKVPSLKSTDSTYVASRQPKLYYSGRVCYILLAASVDIYILDVLLASDGTYFRSMFSTSLIGNQNCIARDGYVISCLLLLSIYIYICSASFGWYVLPFL
jgi:hypothetical protein